MTQITIKKNYLYIVIALVIVFVSTAVIFLINFLPTQRTTGLITQTNFGSTVGSQATPFSFTDINGNLVTLQSLKGKPVLLAFMATWCIPCQIEAENVRAVQEQGYNFYVIQLDVDNRETASDLINFRNVFGRPDWILGFDRNLEIATVYNVRSFDTTIVIDADGQIIYRDDGWPIDTKTLKDILEGRSIQFVLGSTHEHADIQVVINGSETDFSQKKYQVKSSFTHFENGDGKTIHVHAKGVTIKYLFETLGWDYSFKLGTGTQCLTTDFGEFCDGELIVTINGNKNNLDYEIKDGDKIEVVYK